MYGLLVLESLADFFIFHRNNQRVRITVAMVLDEDSLRLLVTIVIDKPAGTFWEEWKWYEAQNGRQELEL